ncbi:hypothetical protein Tco_1101910 [Tanacetum coccineum]
MDDVNLPTPISKPQSPPNEPSHPLTLRDSCKTHVGHFPNPPQDFNQTQLTQPLFPHSLINPHIASVLHAQTSPSPQGDNHTHNPLPPSPSREMLMNDINQLQDLSNLLAMHLSQRNTSPSPYSPNLPYTLNLDQVVQHVGYCPCCVYIQKQFLTLREDINWIEFLLTRPQPPPQIEFIIARFLGAVEKERKAKNILLMAIPKEHMRRFHGMDDAKEIWEAIRTRFGGNANSKKMQKAVFKQQFEAFRISNSEGLEKGYDRFQQLLSQLEAHGAEVSTEDANHKFLRSLPSAWSNLAMTMRTNPEIDNLSIDDLYNNLRVFEQEIQGASKTSSSAQNVAFVSQSKSSTNKVCCYEVIYSLFAKQTEDLDLLHEDLEQIDDVDIEEMDINWQIAMIAIRMKKFYKKTGRRVRVDGKTPVGLTKRKLDALIVTHWSLLLGNGTSKERIRWVLLSMDDGIVNWGEHTEAEETNHALMAISSSNEVSFCDQEAQILAYSQAVKKLEAQLVTSQKQHLSLNEKLAFQANEIHEKDEKLKRYRRIGMKAVKDKEQLQKTVDSWKDSSKNLWRLINSGMSSNDKLGLGFEIQSNDEVLSYEEEMNFSVFKCSKEDSIGKPSYSRFTKTNVFKGVPPPLSGDYTPGPQEE